MDSCPLELMKVGMLPFLAQLRPKLLKRSITLLDPRHACYTLCYPRGDIHKIALSKFTSRRSRRRRRSVLTTIKRNFSCAVGQVNFDGKLLPNLYGYGKIVLVKENVNQLLCITETADSTGLIEARAVEAALNDWGCAEKIVANSDSLWASTPPLQTPGFTEELAPSFSSSCNGSFSGWHAATTSQS